MRLIPIMLMALCCYSNVYAAGTDSLTLTDAEMQKLKNYFPTTDDNSHLIWQGDPISIALPVGKEKRIVFPTSVTVDIKGQLTKDQLQIINNDKSIYLTALKDLPKTRIYITQDNNEVILVDIVTDKNADNSTQYIDAKTDNQTPSTIATTTSNTDLNANTQPESTISYVEMIRFAWESMYAPKRLLDQLPQYSRVPLHTTPFINNLVFGNPVFAHPIASWFINGEYVTSVALQNKYAHKVHIDIRKNICGDWKAASFYPTSHLKTQGNKDKDATTLFLVSEKTFTETLGACNGDA